jgi:uncharacterized protein (UPF0333 family)
MTTLKNLLRKKLAVIFLIAVSAIGAYATLGDGRNSDNPKRSLLSTRSASSANTLSLRSGYSYRGSQVINTSANRFFNINTSITLQKGHTAYTVPLKKKMVLNNKVTFNPNAATRR